MAKWFIAIIATPPPLSHYLRKRTAVTAANRRRQVRNISAFGDNCPARTNNEAVSLTLSSHSQNLFFLTQVWWKRFRWWRLVFKGLTNIILTSPLGAVLKIHHILYLSHSPQERILTWEEACVFLIYCLVITKLLHIPDPAIGLSDRLEKHRGRSIRSRNQIDGKQFVRKKLEKNGTVFIEKE